MKYIIKNCPNCWTYNRPKAVCGLTYKRGGFKNESESYEYCENEEKCLLKQIVKKVNTFRSSYADIILELLEITESEQQ